MTGRTVAHFEVHEFLSSSLIRNETTRARFLLEARAASKLDHPNIAVVYEVGTWEGEAFIAMGY